MTDDEQSRGTENDPAGAERSPDPGHPVGDVEPYGGVDAGDEEPMHAKGTPPIGSDQQHRRHTSDEEPRDDADVSEDSRTS
jgi:hypothetical protein